MKNQIESFQNIDKSTNLAFNEIDSFKIFQLHNLTDNVLLYKYNLGNNYIQIYLSTKNKSNVAFNIEHCAINLSENNASMVYFKDQKMNLFFKIYPGSELFIILISLEYFHSLFSIEDDVFNFTNLKSDRPIIEPKEIGPAIKMILNQLSTKNINSSLKSLYVKGKLYEFLSYYFSSSEKYFSKNCPYITTAETVQKIKLARNIIIKELIDPPSLAELAKNVGLNVKKLKHEFKDYYGTPVFTYLLNYKMEMAKKLLFEQQSNVNEIAIQLGYSSSSHFIVAFKRKFGITPKQFSKSIS